MIRLIESPTIKCGRYRLIGDDNCNSFADSYEFKSSLFRRRIPTISASQGYPDISISGKTGLLNYCRLFWKPKRAGTLLRRNMLKTREIAFLVVTFCLVAFEISLLAILVLFPYLTDPGLSNLNIDVYSFLAPLSTVSLLGLLYAWLVKLGTRAAVHRSLSFKSFLQFLSVPFRNLISSVRAVSLSDSARTFKILSHPKLMLAISMVIGSLLAFVPYRPDLNPSGALVGVDSPTYVTWISQMTSKPPVQALQYSFVTGLDGSRPLLLILLYLVASTGISPDLIIEYLPIVLAPLLSLSSYVFVRYGHGSANFAALAALFTPLSFYVTVAMWGGYYANMLGLIEAYFFLTFLLLFSKSPSTTRYGAMFALSIMLFLNQPWTWALIITASLFFAVSLWKETSHSIHLKSIIGMIASGIILDVLKSSVFATRTVAADLVTKVPTVEQAASFWTNLVDALLYTHGGVLGNWLILGLGLLSVFALRLRDRFERLLIIWVGAASLPFLILDSYHQARIVYDLPTPVLGSIAVLFFLPQLVTRNIRWPGLLIVLLLVLSANYALQSILFL